MLLVTMLILFKKSLLGSFRHMEAFIKGDLHLQNTHHPVNTLQRGTQGRECRETRECREARV